jgi:hypothetical protein
VHTYDPASGFINDVEVTVYGYIIGIINTRQIVQQDEPVTLSHKRRFRPGCIMHEYERVANRSANIRTRRNGHPVRVTIGFCFYDGGYIRYGYVCRT